MKKLLVLALLAFGGVAIVRRVLAQRADLDLWSEATGATDATGGTTESPAS